MIKTINILKFISIFFILVWNATAFSEILSLDFQDASGNQKSLPPDKVYINPDSVISVKISAGIDRYIKLRFVSDSGNIVSDSKSEFITYQDRITHDGSQYYGVRLDINAPKDGKYTLIADTISLSDSVVNTHAFDIVVDTEAPKANPEFKCSVFAGLGCNINYIGKGMATLYLDGFIEANGLASIKAFIKNIGTGDEKEFPLDVYQGKAFLDMTGHRISTFVPENNAKYEVRFEFSDRADNHSSYSRISFGQNALVDIEPSDIWDSRNNVWIPYEEGMTVHDNPVLLRLKAPLHSIAEFNPDGLGIRDPKNLTIEGDTAYFQPRGPGAYRKQFPAEANGSNYWRLHTNGGTYKDFLHWNFKINLADNAKLAPTGSQDLQNRALQVKLSDETNWNGGYLSTSVNRSMIRKSDEVTLEAALLTLENPVTYPVIARFSYRPMNSGYTHLPCLIPIGEVSCEVQVGHKFKKEAFPLDAGHIPMFVFFDEAAVDYDENGEVNGFTSKGTFLAPKAQYTSLSFDFNSPVIRDVNLDTDRKIISAKFIETEAYDLSTSDSWRFGFSLREFYAINEEGKKTFLPVEWTNKLNRYNSSVGASYSGLRDGKYTFVIHGLDKYDRHVYHDMENIVVDETPPTIEFSGGDVIYTLDDYLITLSDSVDKAPQIVSVNLQGGLTNENINLATRHVDGNVYALEYPVLFPSLTEDEQYTLTVIAKDYSGNIQTKKLTFSYQPHEVKLNGTFEGKYMIPPVAHEFSRSDGTPVFSTDVITKYNGDPLQSAYDIFASLHHDSDLDLVINGVTVKPGETKKVWQQYDFKASGGKFAIGLHPAVTGQHGDVKLVLATTAPNAPIMISDIHVWQADVKLTNHMDWRIRQVIDPVTTRISTFRASQCRITTDIEYSKGSTPFYPVCLLEWGTLPRGLHATTIKQNGFESPGIIGRLLDLGKHNLAYDLYMFDVDGSKHKIGSFNQSLESVDPSTAILTNGRQPIAAAIQQTDPFARAVSPILITLNQDKGPACPMSLNQSPTRNVTASIAPLKCRIEWTEIPNGLEQSDLVETPELTGYIGMLGDFQLGWKIYAYTDDSEEVLVNNQVGIINTKDPDKPMVELFSKYKMEEKYIVPIDKKYIGVIQGKQDLSDVNLSLYKDDYSLGQKTFEAGNGRYSKITMSVPLQPSPLWQASIYKADVAYNLLPEIYSHNSYNVFTAPASTTVPLISMENKEALNNKPFPVKLSVRNRSKPEQDYDADTMGHWEAALVSVDRTTELPLTPYKSIDSVTGDVDFDVDLKDFEASYIRLRGKIRSVNPIGYQHEITTYRDIYINVLRAFPVKAEIKTKRISGVEPLRASFNIALDNISDRTAAGKVVWTIKKDGQPFETVESTDRSKLYLTRNFDHGVYTVNAKITNIHSGAVSYIDEIEVVAYKMLDIKIEGTGTVFIGDNATLKAVATDKRTGEKLKDVIYEWSVDDGKTYVRQGPTLTTSSTEKITKKIRLRAKPTSAPDSDVYSWKKAIKYVAFKNFKPARAYVRIPARVETGKTYTFTAKVYNPYSKMDTTPIGEFLFPDGSVERGESIDYTIREADLTDGKMKIIHRSWVDGFKTEGTYSEKTLTTRVWQYVWPNFNLSVKANTVQAPSKVTAYIIPKGSKSHLEDLTYSWVLPPGVDILYDRISNKRVFSIENPGDYRVKVIATDKRGNETTLEHELTLVEPDPFKVTLKPYQSNKYSREPLKVTVRTYISGGHPDDRPSLHSYLINGEKTEADSTRPSFNLNAGNHVLTYEGISEMGVTFEENLPIDVEVNKKPACSISVRETVSTWYFSAKCKDEDGRVVAHKWTVDDEVRSVSSYKFTLNKTRNEDGSYKPMPKLIHQAMDDSGAESEPVVYIE